MLSKIKSEYMICLSVLLYLLLSFLDFLDYCPVSSRIVTYMLYFVVALEMLYVIKIRVFVKDIYISTGIFYIYTLTITVATYLGSIRELVRDCFYVSFWYFSILFFSIVIKKNSSEFLKKILLKLIQLAIVFMAIYIVWIFNGRISSSGTGTNAIHFIVLLLPCVFIIEKKNKKVLFIALILITTILSTKRQDFIVAIIGITIPYMIQIFFTDNNDKFKKIFSIMLVTLLVITAYINLENRLNLEIFARLSSIKEDGGSGRTQIWKNVWDAFDNGSLLQKIFGHGYSAVARDRVGKFSSYGVNYTSAHNDFLETLYDYGVCGLIMYSLFLISFIKKVFKVYACDIKIGSMYLCSIISYLVLCSLGHLLLYPTYIVFPLLFFTIGELTESNQLIVCKNGLTQKGVMS